MNFLRFRADAAAFGLAAALGLAVALGAAFGLAAALALAGALVTAFGLAAAEGLAVRTLTENRKLLGHVTEALLEERELDSRQIAMLVESNEPYRPTQELSAQGTDTLVM